VRFVREAGWGNAMRYMLTGDHWTAQEPIAWYGPRDCSHAKVALDRALEIANKVATCGPLASKPRWRLRIWPLILQRRRAFKIGCAIQRALPHARLSGGRKAEAEGRSPIYHGN